jgi:hypothetical protein
MARLPTPGSDDGTWGDVLNTFLEVAHNTDGSLADGSVSTGAITDGTVTEAKLSSGVQTKLNSSAAVTSVNSKTGAVVLNADDISDTTATHKFVTATDKTKLSNLSGTNTGDQDLSGLVTKTTTVNGHALSANVTVSKSDVGLTNVDNTSDANKPISSATQTALNAKANDASVVHTSGAETIAGTKTFSASPVVPTPSTGSDAANKTYVDSVVGGGGAVTWGGISGTLSDQTDLQAALDNSVHLDEDFFITGDGTAGITHSTPGIGLGVETGGNNNAHMEINSPTSGVAYMDFTTVNVDYQMRMGWYDALNEFKFQNMGQGDLLTIDSSGNVAVTGSLSASNLSGTNTGDQDLSGLVTKTTTVNGHALSTNVTVSKSDVGLGNVDNTSDANKPVSSATQTALNAKAASGANSDITSLSGLSTPLSTAQGGTGSASKNFVDLTTAQTVGGVKAFSSSPTVPTPTNNTDVANKSYVDTTASAGTPDATSSTKGKLQLTGDLGGTAASPTVPGLANKLPLKNGNPQLTDSTNDDFARIDITDDGSPTAGWPDRMAFYFSGTRSGYHNEYGELRARPAKSSTVALRAMKWAGSSTSDIFQVATSDASTIYLGVGPSTITASIPISSTANISTTGTVTGSNIGNKVTSSSTAPSSPSVGDVWIDTSS